MLQWVSEGSRAVPADLREVLAAFSAVSGDHNEFQGAPRCLDGY